MPSGADHIVIQEHCRRIDGQVEVMEPQHRARHIRKAGIDFSTGDIVLEKGVRLGPAELMMAAASDHADLLINKPLRVAILSNGNELRAPGSMGAPGEIVSSNVFGLAALVRQLGGEVQDLGIAKDRLSHISSRIDIASNVDLIIAVGGASVGEHDLMRTAFDEAGFALKFSQINMKPGKPTWFGTRLNTCVLGLPGNPGAAFIAAQVFLPTLLGDGSRRKTISAFLASALPSAGPRDHFVLAYVEIMKNLGWRVEAVAQDDTSLITPFLHANCVIRRRAGDGEASENDRVEVFPFSVN